MYRTDFWTLWKKAREGWSERIASKHVYYQVWKRSPVQVGCMRQVLRAGALGWLRGMGWGGRREGVSGWGTHVNPWLIHVNVWQNPLQYCKIISLQLIKINEKKKKRLSSHIKPKDTYRSPQDTPGQTFKTSRSCYSPNFKETGKLKWEDRETCFKRKNNKKA